MYNMALMSRTEGGFHPVFLKVFPERALVPQNVPVYSPLSGGILIGVNHVDPVNKVPQKKAQFQRLLQDCDALIMESTPDSLADPNAPYDLVTFEHLAIQTFQGPTYYVEMGVNVKEVLIRYGIPRASFGMFHVSIVVPEALNRSGHQLPRFVENLRRNFHSDQDIASDANRIIDIMLSEINRLGVKKAEDYFGVLSLVYQHFRGQIREFEILTPRTQKLLHDLPGHKAVIVGAGHFNYLKENLAGTPKIRPRPPSWNQVIMRLPPEYQDFVDHINRATS